MSVYCALAYRERERERESSWYVYTYMYMYGNKQFHSYAYNQSTLMCVCVCICTFVCMYAYMQSRIATLHDCSVPHFISNSRHSSACLKTTHVYLCTYTELTYMYIHTCSHESQHFMIVQCRISYRTAVTAASASNNSCVYMYIYITDIYVYTYIQSRIATLRGRSVPHFLLSSLHSCECLKQLMCVYVYIFFIHIYN